MFSDIYSVLQNISDLNSFFFEGRSSCLSLTWTSPSNTLTRIVKKVMRILTFIGSVKNVGWLCAASLSNIFCSLIEK